MSGKERKTAGRSDGNEFRREDSRMMYCWIESLRRVTGVPFVASEFRVSWSALIFLRSTCANMGHGVCLTKGTPVHEGVEDVEKEMWRIYRIRQVSTSHRLLIAFVYTVAR